MGRRIRWTVLALVVVVVTGIVILVITVRPGLQDDAQEVRRTWRPLVEPLGVRYATLNAVVGALQNAGNADREITQDLDRTLGDWDILRATTDDSGQARTANELEALAARVRTIVEQSPRLKATQPLTASLAAFDRTTVPPRLVRRYNDAVLEYEKNRDGTLRNIVASLDGYEQQPTLQISRPG
jgi:hypothetical protein